MEGVEASVEEVKATGGGGGVMKATVEEVEPTRGVIEATVEEVEATRGVMEATVGCLGDGGHRRSNGGYC